MINELIANEVMCDLEDCTGLKFNWTISSDNRNKVILDTNEIMKLTTHLKLLEKFFGWKQISDFHKYIGY